MRAGGGKQKGANFEREICKRISLWLTNGERDDCLWRSAMSGGRATVQMRKGNSIRQCGDIAAVSEEGIAFTNQWYVEIKHYKDLQLGSFFLCGTGNLFNFWRICVREAKKYNRDPMLIAKQNARPTIVITRPDALASSTLPFIHADLTNRYAVDVTRFEDWMNDK
jgi:hypothetical protein